MAMGVAYQDIDLHNMTVAEAKRALDSFLNTVSPQCLEVTVIHGYNGGKAILNMVRRDYKHRRVERKILGLNQGSTTLVLKKP